MGGGRGHALRMEDVVGKAALQFSFLNEYWRLLGNASLLAFRLCGGPPFYLNDLSLSGKLPSQSKLNSESNFHVASSKGLHVSELILSLPLSYYYGICHTGLEIPLHAFPITILTIGFIPVHCHPLSNLIPGRDLALSVLYE